MSCSRTWQVAAARDGRLGVKARVDHERHLSRCEACSKELASLDTLGARLRATSVVEPDDLALRRLRARTLEAADAAIVQRTTRPRAPMLVAFVAALTLAAALGILVLRRPAMETRFVATDEGHAQWSAHDEGEVRHISLRDGELAVWVDRPAGGKRVLVHVPDGEIEDLGTVFHVAVEGGQTRRVRVDEGAILLRLRGEPERRVAAGETWEARRAIPPAAARAVVESPPPPLPPDAGVSTRGALPSPAPMASPTRKGATPAPQREPTDLPDAADAEDHAYVEVVRLLRTGRTAEAKAAARDYVHRFPNGFRRTEIERVLTSP